MKKILFTLITCMTFFSCSKDPDYPTPKKYILGSVRYKVNGQLVTLDNKNVQSGEYILFSKQIKGAGLTQTRYVLNAQKAINNTFIFAILSDSLQQINYHYDSAAVNNQQADFVLVLAYHSEVSTLFYSGDYLDVNITSYNNSRISGTFSAKLTPETSLFDYNNRGKTIITDGVINSVPVDYF